MTRICTSCVMRPRSSGFVCTLWRHTYATRAIESGVLPKVLQRLLGHSSIKTTMDRYVHVTDDSPSNAIKQFEQNTSLAS